MTPHPALVARRRRIQSIRRRVAAGAAALFIALFSGLYIQMSAGDDPALGTQTAQVSKTTATGSSSSGTSDSASSQASAPMTTAAS